MPGCRLDVPAPNALTNRPCLISPMPDLNAIMTVMDAAFDPVFGEAWTRTQVADALALPGVHAMLASPERAEWRPGEPAAGFFLSRGALDEEELLLLAVDPAWQGRGIGSWLLARFVGEARSRGRRRLFLEMRDGNRAASFYRRGGFTEVGRRRDYYRRGLTGPHDAITFALEYEAG